MIQLNNYIIEKLHINKDTLLKSKFNNVDEMCDYLTANGLIVLKDKDVNYNRYRSYLLKKTNKEFPRMELTFNKRAPKYFCIHSLTQTDDRKITINISNNVGEHWDAKDMGADFETFNWFDGDSTYNMFVTTLNNADIIIDIFNEIHK